MLLLRIEAMKLYIILITVFFAVSSFGASRDNKETPSNEVEPLAEQELSLKKDREHLDKLRKDIPEDVKRDNDDLAYILKLFEDPNKKPSRIRGKFNDTIRKARKKNQKKFKKLRKEFTKKEKKARKDFLKKQKEERNKFMADKPDKEKSREFYNDQTAKRREYFADQRDKRKDFESEVRSQKKEFDLFLRDKRKQFDDHYRAFIKEQQASRRAKKQAEKEARKKASAARYKPTITSKEKQMLEDFKKVPKGPGIPLQPTKDE